VIGTQRLGEAEPNQHATHKIITSTESSVVDLKRKYQTCIRN
jgi:hypothetical protein